MFNVGSSFQRSPSIPASCRSALGLSRLSVERLALPLSGVTVRRYKLLTRWTPAFVRTGGATRRDCPRRRRRRAAAVGRELYRT